MAEFDMQEFIQKQVHNAVIRVNHSIEQHVETVLRRVFEAGYERGADDVAYECRGDGPQLGRPPSFEEFVDELLAELREEAE